MNIYWCQELEEPYGLYIIAKTRGRAKDMFSREVGCDYISVRTKIFRRGVTETIEGEILEDSPLLKKYNLEYADYDLYDFI